ncbi:MAG: hypothetical protein ACPGC9_02200, partial [Cytophagales bacterium]
MIKFKRQLGKTKAILLLILGACFFGTKETAQAPENPSTVAFLPLARMDNMITPKPQHQLDQKKENNKTNTSSPRGNLHTPIRSRWTSIALASLLFVVILYSIKPPIASARFSNFKCLYLSYSPKKQLHYLLNNYYEHKLKPTKAAIALVTIPQTEIEKIVLANTKKDPSALKALKTMLFSFFTKKSFTKEWLTQLKTCVDQEVINPKTDKDEVGNNFIHMIGDGGQLSTSLNRPPKEETLQKTINYLIDKGCDINAKNKAHNPAFWHLLDYIISNSNIVRPLEWLKKFGCNFAKQRNGQTLLHRVLVSKYWRGSKLEAVNCLIENGGVTNTTGAYNILWAVAETPWKFKRDHLEIVKKLMGAGANTCDNTTESVTFLNKMIFSGMWDRHQKAQYDIIKYVIEQDSKVNLTKKNQKGESPLWLALMDSSGILNDMYYVKIIKLIVKGYKERDLDPFQEKGYLNQSVLCHFMDQFQHSQKHLRCFKEIFTLLIAEGAGVNPRSEDRESPLINLLLLDLHKEDINIPEMITMLLTHGANPTLKGTPSHRIQASIVYKTFYLPQIYNGLACSTPIH